MVVVGIGIPLSESEFISDSKFHFLSGVFPFGIFYWPLNLRGFHQDLTYTNFGFLVFPKCGLIRVLVVNSSGIMVLGKGKVFTRLGW